MITRNEILDAHKLLVEFCSSFQMLYGSEVCTPNMHMACHLKDSMLDYGPLPASHWKGIMEGMAKSWLQPEKQMLSKFRDLQFLKNIGDTSILGNADICCLPMFLPDSTRGSVEQTMSDTSTILNETAYHTCAVSLIDAREKDYQILLSPLSEKVFDGLSSGDVFTPISIL